MKWSKKKENDVDTLISFIIGEIDNKCKSGELPDWVVDQVEKRLAKINIYYEEAKRTGFEAVGLLIVSLLAVPISMIFAKGDMNFVLLGVLTFIMGMAGADNLFEDKRKELQKVEDAKVDLINEVLFGEEITSFDKNHNGFKELPEGIIDEKRMSPEVRKALEAYMEEGLSELFD
jgi:hypothetical protein